MTMPIYGSALVGFAAIETAFDTPQLHVAADSVGFTELKIEPFLTYTKSKEHRGTQTLATEVKGKQGGKWSCKFYVKPQTAGSEPEGGPIIEAALGSVSGSTYSLAAIHPQSLQISGYTDADHYEQVNGSWVEQLDVEVSGSNNEAMISASGGFSSYSRISGSPTTGAAAAGVAVSTITAGMIGRVVSEGCGMLVMFKDGTKDNGNAGYKITDVNYSTGVITFTPAIQAGEDVDAADAILPITPTWTSTGTIQGATDSDLSIGGASFGMMQGKYSLKTGHHARDAHATSNRPIGLARGERDLSAEFTVEYLEEEAELLGKAWGGTLYAVNMRVGPTTANNKCTCAYPNARIEVTPISIPDADEATAVIKAIPRQSSAAEDEYSITFA